MVRILQNEKYCGNAILQKTYKRDLVSKRSANNGEVRKYLVENGYEAIITPEQFEMAQQELEARRKENRQHSSKSIFISKLVCGDCGCFFAPRSPAISVTVLHPVSVEEEPGEVILHVDIHCLAAFDEGIEECRNFRTGLSDAEKEGLSSYHKGAYHVLMKEVLHEFLSDLPYPFHHINHALSRHIHLLFLYDSVT